MLRNVDKAFNWPNNSGKEPDAINTIGTTNGKKALSVEIVGFRVGALWGACREDVIVAPNLFDRK
jgi:hypothetical protein